ncbi:hypothetical protein J1605_018594 [Eschrichtius robustus]|uniref:Uncharacterized protein n=1 Tax=Eschrichtius robustus TaxID=9764 RepID=A0AB34HVD2_ESCRO|nr:hypothetical protein J1605_018594 [Eschrichtius robustus]
MATEHPLTR